MLTIRPDSETIEFPDGGPIMKSMVSSTVLVAVLGHAALGCCWHHAHSAGSEGDSHAATRGREHHAGHSHAIPGHNHLLDLFAQQQGDEREHDHVPCQDDSCTYLTTKSVELSDAPAPSETDWLIRALSLPERHTLPADAGALFSTTPACSQEHCALTQVWLL